MLPGRYFVLAPLVIVLSLASLSFGATADDAWIEELVQAVASPNQATSDSAIRQVLGDRALRTSVLGRLVHLSINASQASVQLAALSALSAFRELAEPTIPTLLMQLGKEPNGQVRGAIAVCVATVGDAATEVVEAIAAQLRRESSPETKIEMLRALALMNGDRSAALPTLVSILESSKDHRIRALAVGAMKGPWAIGSLPLLVRLVSSDPHDATRHNALLALGSFGDAGRPALAAIDSLHRLAEKNGDTMLANDCSMAEKQILGTSVR